MSLLTSAAGHSVNPYARYAEGVLSPESERALLLRLRQKDPTLTEVKWTLITTDTLVSLIDAARGAPLRSLKLGHLGPRYEAYRIAPQLADMLNSLAFLRELDVQYLPLPPMKLDLPPLREIRVSVFDLSIFSGRMLDKFLQSLSGCLQRNDTVQFLSVAAVMCKVEASAATWNKLAEALRQRPTITAVTIGSSNLGDDGMLAMQAAVQHNPRILSLRLGETAASDNGVAAFKTIEPVLEQRLKQALGSSLRLPVAAASAASVANAVRPVERKEDVESRSEAPSFAAASSSTDKTTAVPSSSMSAVASDPSWDPQKPLSVRRQLCEQEDALIRTVQQLSLAETELERARNNHQLQQAERTQQILQREREIAALSQQHQRLSAEHQTLQAQLASEVQLRVDQMAQLQQQRDQLNDELEELRERRMCCICKDSEVDAMFLACSHTVCCAGCAQHCVAQGRCPICRAAIGDEDVRRVHFA